MAKTFASLRKQRKSNADKLDKMMDQFSGGNKFQDPEADTYWKLSRDKAENGYAEIRFLPAPAGEDFPSIRTFSHFFKGPGGWYAEKSRATIGEDDPVGEYNHRLWNSVSDNDAPERNQCRKQKRSLEYISNIYVVKDPANPENEGKVFRFKYRNSIFKMIQAKLKPEFEAEDRVDIFDLWEGCTLKLKARKTNIIEYTASEWMAQGPLFDDDEKLEEIWNQCHPLAPLVAPDQFKSYDELKEKLYRVLGINMETEGQASPRKSETTHHLAGDKDFEIDDSIPDFEDVVKGDTPAEESPPKQEKKSVDDSDDSDDDDLKYFQDLVD